ncbi:hypothetical protein WJX72_010567 [[Myrmecia] bisecta]|uniref:Uncharacterized protein n=1 Tax=[Myrmecia] bisecta TaxID=41462 RepID=A0AAW1PI54_9CHLO
MQLNDEVVRSFGMGRVFKEKQARVNSLDFHRTEDLLVTAGDDDSIHVYNTSTGQAQRNLFSKKYGVSNICFTHHPQAVIHASNKGSEHAVRYLSLHDNRYLRYFRGHTARVTMLCMSPKTDLFMSASLDRTVRVWDLRTTQSQGLLQAPGQPCAAFDQQGLVFCIGTQSGIIKLYDVRTFDKGPFETFTVPDLVNSAMAFSYTKFSADGKLLLAVAERNIFVLDAYTGGLLHRFSSGIPDGGTALEATFSADCQYVLSGCEDRCIRAWSTLTGQEVAAWKGHAGVPTSIKWAPRRMLVASACSALALWVPNTSAFMPQQ